MSVVTIVELGDSCFTVTFATVIDEAVNERCIAAAAAIERRAIPGIRDVVPTYNAVTVHVDPLIVDRRAFALELHRLVEPDTRLEQTPPRSVEIPVSYGGENGPDLADVAKFANYSEDDVIRLHTAATYRVYMLGFLPGFAYMGSVDARIAMPRLETPRMRVPTGSVGIAGQQTGVYPFDSPGGWRIIGRTSMLPFDASRPEPFLFKAGDRVKFVPV